jgi:hypothetical protein
MKQTAWPVIVLATLLTALAPMAHASPPDPSWIPGVYDEGDFDDVVALVTQTAGRVDTTPLDDRGPELVVVDLLGPVSEHALPSSPRSPSPTRGPPAL